MQVEAMAVASGSADAHGHTWTGLGDLRIRRLGVRVAPGALMQPVKQKGRTAWFFISWSY